VTTLVLIRHALTDTTGRRLTGWTPGVHLSSRGRQQAEALAERLDPVPLEAVYSSPLERCRETALHIAARRGLAIHVARDLGEIRFGAWTDRPLAQLARTKLWRRVQAAPSTARFPEGESMPEAQARAAAAVERIVARHPKAAVGIVSHADTIKLLVAHLAGIHLDLFQRLVIDPASVSVVGLDDGVPRLLLVNDTGSLDVAGGRRPASSDRPKLGGNRHERAPRRNVADRRREGAPRRNVEG
jgi:probable phosphomutase (TIGR03848 family)